MKQGADGISRGDNCSEFLQKEDCNNVRGIGCVDPKNIYSNNGVEPYYIEVPTSSANTPFDTKCIFCWQIKSEL